MSEIVYDPADDIPASGDMLLELYDLTRAWTCRYGLLDLQSSEIYGFESNDEQRAFYPDALTDGLIKANAPPTYYAELSLARTRRWAGGAVALLGATSIRGRLSVAYHEQYLSYNSGDNHDEPDYITPDVQFVVPQPKGSPFFSKSYTIDKTSEGMGSWVVADAFNAEEDEPRSDLGFQEVQALMEIMKGWQDLAVRNAARPKARW